MAYTSRTIDNGSLTDFSLAMDNVGGDDYEYIKLAYGAHGTATVVTSAVGLPVETELTLFDLDSGGGTVSAAGVGILVPASGGPVVVPGDATYGLKTQVTTMPAAARTTDTLSAALATDAIMSNVTALTPKFASIAVSSSGNNTLVAAVTSKKIRVLSCELMANGTVNAKFQSGASGTDITGLKYLVVNTGMVLPFSPVGWFETGSGVLLNMNLSAGVAVGGSLVYIEV